MFRGRKQAVVYFTALALIAMAACMLPSQKAHATAGINQELSFEGKIVSSTGTNITDGNYNAEFVIYTGCTNEPASNAGCTAAWTEDYLTSNTTYSSTVPVAFTSGTFQVNLGAICSFSGGSCEGNTNTAINWDTYPLYVSINVGTTAACATSFTSCGGGTGAMNPYILLTSSPYAMNAGNADTLGGVAASSFVQLSPGSQQTGNINISGTVTSGAVNGVTISSTIQPSATGGLTVSSNGANALTLTSGAAATWSTTSGALTISSASTLSLVGVGRVIVGTGNGGTGSTSPALLVLDDDSSSTDPTEVNGAMYYNASTNQFRCGEQGVWISCIAGMMSSNSAAGTAINTCTTNCAALYSTGAPIPANYCQAGRTIRVFASGVLSTFSTAPTLNLAFYQGTSSTAETSDTLVGAATPTITTTASLANVPWTVEFNIICFSTTQWNASGTWTWLNSATATTADSVFQFTDASTTYSTAASNLYLFPNWGTSKSTNTITLNQWIVTGN